MITSVIGFTLAEKLAIVHALDSIILVDGLAHKAELEAMQQLMNYLDFDSNFIVQARNATREQVLLILKKMPNSKKDALMALLNDMAAVDGFLHEKETSFITNIFSSMDVEEKTS